MPSTVSDLVTETRAATREVMPHDYSAIRGQAVLVDVRAPAGFAPNGRTEAMQPAGSR